MTEITKEEMIETIYEETACKLLTFGCIVDVHFCDEYGNTLKTKEGLIRSSTIRITDDYEISDNTWIHHTRGRIIKFEKDRWLKDKSEKLFYISEIIGHPIDFGQIIKYLNTQFNLDILRKNNMFKDIEKQIEFIYHLIK